MSSRGLVFIEQIGKSLSKVLLYIKKSSSKMAISIDSYLLHDSSDLLKY